MDPSRLRSNGTVAGAGPQQARDAEGRHPGGHRHRRRQVAMIVLAVGAITGGVILGRHTLAESLSDLGSLDWTWFLVAICCEAVSLSAFGLSRRRLLRAEGHQAGFAPVMAVTYASNALSMSIPFAGAELAVVYSYREFRRRGLGPAITGWALAVSAIMSASALALVLIAGAIAGGQSVAAAAGLAGAAIFLLPAAAVLLALRYRHVRAALNRFLARVIGISQRLFRWPGGGAAGSLEDMLDRVAGIRMSLRRYAEVFGFALLNWLGDCACLTCAIRATGQPIPWHGLLLAYAAGVAVGSTGLTPGGFALVEATLTAALVAAGMGTAAALTAVLAYRLINFWMILVGGWALMIFLTHTRPGARTPAARNPDSPAAPE
jgi:putative heme transporter